MSDPTDPSIPDLAPEELASSYVDGELSAEARRRVDADPELLAMVAEHAAARDAVAAPVEGLSERQREDLVATALAALTVGDRLVQEDGTAAAQAVSSDESSGTVVPMASARRARSRRLVQVAAGGLAAVAAVGILALVVSRNGSGGTGNADRTATEGSAAVAADAGGSSEEAGQSATTAAVGAAPAAEAPATQAPAAASGAQTSSAGDSTTPRPHGVGARGPRPAGRPDGVHRGSASLRHDPATTRRGRVRGLSAAAGDRDVQGRPGLPGGGRGIGGRKPIGAGGRGLLRGAREGRPGRAVTARCEHRPRCSGREVVSSAMPDEPTRDWATQITDQIERVVSTIRDRTTRPALTVVRGLVFGVIAVSGAITALVLLSIVLIRVLTELTGQAWIAFLITSGIFLVIGAFLMLKGASSAERDLEGM